MSLKVVDLGVGMSSILLAVCFLLLAIPNVFYDRELTKKVNELPEIKAIQAQFYREAEKCSPVGGWSECYFGDILQARNRVLEAHGCTLAFPWRMSYDSRSGGEQVSDMDVYVKVGVRCL